MTIVLLALGAPLFAQEAGGEANLKLPGSIASSYFPRRYFRNNLLLGGLVVSALGLIFGLHIFTRLRNMPVHYSMLEVSELIYETCKTYLLPRADSSASWKPSWR